MEKDNLNISRIETFLNGIIEDKVSSNTFFGYMPDAAIVKSSDWTDICMVEFPNGVNDKDAYGLGTALIWLCAKPLPSGKKNVAVLSRLEKNLNNAISGTFEGFQVQRRLTFTTYSTEINWHCNVVELQILIV